MGAREHGWWREGRVSAATSLGLVLALVLVPRVAAAQLFDSSDPDAVQIHGFVSQGFLKSTANNYLANSKAGSFSFTEAGLNVSKSLTDNLRLGLQLYVYDLGPLGNYSPRFDWYNLDYHFRDWLGIRVGHTKIPFGLYNETSDIDAARVPVLLPQSVYPVNNRDYLLALTGGELYGVLQLHVAGSLEYRAYGGTLQIDTPVSTVAGISASDFSEPYIYGGRLMWSTPLPGLRVGGSYQVIGMNWKFNFDPAVAQAFQAAGLLPGGFTSPLAVAFDVRLWVASAEYRHAGLRIAAEYSQWNARFYSDAPALLPGVNIERYYVMASYQVARWLAPCVYYSVYYPNMSERDGRQNHQRDAALSLRFDINAHWLVKLEGHWMDGTAALDPSLNGGTSLDALTKDWGLVLIKTTAYF